MFLEGTEEAIPRPGQLSSKGLTPMKQEQVGKGETGRKPPLPPSPLHPIP